MAEVKEYRPPTQSQNSNMFSLAIPSVPTWVRHFFPTKLD